ncbi:type II toxin-antitoxin system VapC family toxin [Rhabdothermincola sp.]|uniref:type II toxin-antitoxin system VapC family toxin n=1 Tax=Rhabdothermincola sp. TaxID=2820405 RepID=UPI002FE40C36
MIVVGTGVLFAAADRSDAHHDRCSEFFDDTREALLVPTPVVIETAWLIGSRLGVDAQATFLSIVSSEIDRVDLTDADWRPVAELVASYRDLDLGVVDAAVVAVAERMTAKTIATVNPRDFRVVRPAHCDAFELVP